MSSPDPLNETSVQTPGVLVPSTRRVTRSIRSERFSTIATSSPRKQMFELEVGDNKAPQRLLVTVETEDPEEPSGNAARRRLFEGTPMPIIRRMEKATTTIVPLKGLEDDDISTPRRRGRPRKSIGTPMPMHTTGKKRKADTPIGKTPRRLKMTPSAADHLHLQAPSEPTRQSLPPPTPLPKSSTPWRRGRPPKNRPTEPPSTTREERVPEPTAAARGRRRRQALAPDEIEGIADELAQVEDDREHEEGQELQENNEAHGDLEPELPEEAAPSIDGDGQTGDYAPLGAGPSSEADSDIWMATMDDQPTPRQEDQIAQSMPSPISRKSFSQSPLPEPHSSSPHQSPAPESRSSSPIHQLSEPELELEPEPEPATSSPIRERSPSVDDAISSSPDRTDKQLDREQSAETFRDQSPEIDLVGLPPSQRSDSSEATILSPQASQQYSEADRATASPQHAQFSAEPEQLAESPAKSLQSTSSPRRRRRLSELEPLDPEPTLPSSTRSQRFNKSPGRPRKTTDLAPAASSPRRSQQPIDTDDELAIPEQRPQAFDSEITARSPSWLRRVGKSLKRARQSSEPRLSSPSPSRSHRSIMSPASAQRSLEGASSILSPQRSLRSFDREEDELASPGPALRLSEPELIANSPARSYRATQSPKSPARPRRVSEREVVALSPQRTLQRSPSHSEEDQTITLQRFRQPESAQSKQERKRPYPASPKPHVIVSPERARRASKPEAPTESQGRTRQSPTPPVRPVDPQGSSRHSLDADSASVFSQVEEFEYIPAAASDHSSFDEPPGDRRSMTNDTVAQGEDFSMILMDQIPSLQNSFNGSHLQTNTYNDIGEETSIIINNTLESLRKSLRDEEEEEAELEKKKPSLEKAYMVDRHLSLKNEGRSFQESLLEDSRLEQEAEQEIEQASRLQQMEDEEEAEEFNLPVVEQEWFQRPERQMANAFNSSPSVQRAPATERSPVHRAQVRKLTESSYSGFPQSPARILLSPQRRKSLSSKWNLSPRWTQSPRRPTGSPLRQELLKSKARRTPGSRAATTISEAQEGTPTRTSRLRQQQQLGQDVSNAYDDSFSEIPERVLDAAMPGRALFGAGRNTQESKETAAKNNFDQQGPGNNQKQEDRQERQTIGWRLARDPLSSGSLSLLEAARLLTPDDTPPQADGEEAGEQGRMHAPQYSPQVTSLNQNGDELETAYPKSEDDDGSVEKIDQKGEESVQYDSEETQEQLEEHEHEQHGYQDHEHGEHEHEQQEYEEGHEEGELEHESVERDESEHEEMELEEEHEEWHGEQGQEYFNEEDDEPGLLVSAPVEGEQDLAEDLVEDKLEEQITGETEAAPQAIEPPLSRLLTELGRPLTKVTPMNQLSSPLQGTQPLALDAHNEKAQRPALSPIVRAGRGLQSVTSDPPSPEGREQQLRSPSRNSVSRDSVQGGREVQSGQRLSGSPRRSLSYQATQPVSEVPSSDDPFGSASRSIQTGQRSFMEALNKNASTESLPVHKELAPPEQIFDSMRNTRASEDQMIWIEDEGPISPKLRGDNSLQDLTRNFAPATNEGRLPPRGKSHGEIEAQRRMEIEEGPGEQQEEDDDDDMDIWEFEAERSLTQLTGQKPEVRKASNPVQRQRALLSPKTTQGTDDGRSHGAFSQRRGAERMPEPKAEPEIEIELEQELEPESEQGFDDEPEPMADSEAASDSENEDAHEFSMLAERERAEEQQVAPRSAKPNRFDLSTFFSSPAAIPGILAAKTRSMFQSRPQEQEPEQETTQTLPTSSMFPQVSRRNAQTSHESQTDYSSPIRPNHGRVEAPGQESSSRSDTPEMDEALPIISQKKDFTPKPNRKTNAEFFQPSAAQSSATTPPRMQLTHADIERWQHETSQASEESPVMDRLRLRLRPLPPRGASPAKSSLRSPLKPHTPGRVVEFTSSVLSPVEQARVRHERRQSNLSASQPSYTNQGREDKENHDVSDDDMPEVFFERSPTPEPLSQTVWTREHWLLLDELLQIRRGSPFDPPYERCADRYLGKTVKSYGEMLKLERWHLDCIDAFKAEVGGWDEGILAKRLFALIMGEERRSRGLAESPAKNIFH